MQAHGYGIERQASFESGLDVAEACGDVAMEFAIGYLFAVFQLLEHPVRSDTLPGAKPGEPGELYFEVAAGTRRSGQFTQLTAHRLG